MGDFIIRTEELTDIQIKKMYVQTKNDNEILDKLKSQSPTILVGSRGIGKSFIFKISQMNLQCEFISNKVFTVFITFRKASLIQTANKAQFEVWMLNRICTGIIRALKKEGLIVGDKWAFGNISGEENKYRHCINDLMEINKKFEESWKNPGEIIDAGALPTIDEFMDLIEELCSELDIARFIIYIDEAAHIFIPEQQRQFFTMFREIRSAYIKCNASVYPGVTCYGDTFEPMHDAVMVNLERDVREEEYVSKMKEMVLNQVHDSEVLKNIMNNGANFTLLAYASGGNPRLFLKSVEEAGNFKTAMINKVFREFYREKIWTEQSSLAEKYPGNSVFVDWGRKFIESIVLPELKDKNDRFMEKSKETSIYFWIHRNSPQAVKEALRLLEYTGIIKVNSVGIRATGDGIGTRYEVNLGCLLALEATPTANAFYIINNLSIGRMSEYGANSKAYDEILLKVPTFMEPDMSESLKIQLVKDIVVLELTSWQVDKLRILNINTIGDLLQSTEADLMKAYYVGEIKARQMKNAALAAVYEYLFG